jgi:hypothetical protein
MLERGQSGDNMIRYTDTTGLMTLNESALRGFAAGPVGSQLDPDARHFCVIAYDLPGGLKDCLWMVQLTTQPEPVALYMTLPTWAYNNLPVTEEEGKT